MIPSPNGDTPNEDEVEKALYTKAIWLIENGYVIDISVEALVEQLKKKTRV